MSDNPSTASPVKRCIRSFIRRDSRLTRGQQNAIDQGWDCFGLNVEDNIFIPEQTFSGHAPVILEIGFGNGESLAEMACQYPHYNFIGIDTHKPGVGHLLIEINRLGLENLRVYHADALIVLKECIRNGSISGIHIFFPDPWQKRRHHKRRLINHSFLLELSAKLMPGGYLFIATDWADYAQSINSLLHSGTLPLQSVNLDHPSAVPIPERPQTRFESRGLLRGHSIHEFRYRKQ